MSIQPTITCMGNRIHRALHSLPVLIATLISVLAPQPTFGEPSPAASSAFEAYVRTVEARLAKQHQSEGVFLTPLASQPTQSLLSRPGVIDIEQIGPSTGVELSGAILYHWRASVFEPGAKAADLDRLLRDFNRYPQQFAPQVLRAAILSQQDNRIQATLRVRQNHVIAVVLDSTYDVAFGRLNPQNGYSASRSTSIREIDAAGTDHERALDSGQDHGFLWRLNTYWTYQERHGGLYIQVESVSLSRTIPAGLGWLVRPFTETIPRESLEFTLRSACTGLRK